MANTVRQFRVGGSGYTAFRWDNKLVAFARQTQHTSPPPVAQAVPIQPLDERRPLEIITPAAVSMGQLTVEITELYGAKVWDQLAHIAGSNDLVDIFFAVANTPTAINMVKVIRPPERGTGVTAYTDIFHNCVITNVLDGETIEVGTMDINKTVQIAYTHTTRSDRRN